MLLYPRLPLTIARKMTEELVLRQIEHLQTVSDIEHPAATYAPTGGNRVTEARLHEISQHLREIAGKYNYPRSFNNVNTREFDANLGKILHEMLEITPSEASNPGIWAFMSCVLLPDIVRWRFPGNADGTNKERFLGGRRNTFGRVWWRAHIFKQSDAENPYELLYLLGEDDLVQVTERPSLAGSPTLAKEVCRTFLIVTEPYDRTNVSRAILRNAVKRLRRLLPMTSFDALDDQILQILVNEIFQSTIQSLQKQYIGNQDSV